MENIFKYLRKFFESGFLLKILSVLGVALIALIIFYAGINVGFYKASFGKAWGENYERNFGFGPNHPLIGNDNFPNANGAIGRIIKIELPTIIVEDRGNIEKVISINADTQLEEMRQKITTSDLAIGDFVVVIGTPNTQGQIDAKFIRIMPAGMPTPLPMAQ